MASRVKLTIAAANVLLKGIKWRSYSTEYQVMVRKVTAHPDTGKVATHYAYAHAKPRWTHDSHQRIFPQDTYRDALVEINRLSPDDQANAVIFRIKTERPS